MNQIIIICPTCGSRLPTAKEITERGRSGERTFITPGICVKCATPGKRKFNLIYHITPTANYRWNIEQLVKRWDLFTGNKLFAIARGDGFDKLENVLALFPEPIDYILVDNHPELRETHSLAALLLRASLWDKGDATFYAHTKGITRGGDLAVQLWTEAMYHFNLDYPERLNNLLDKFPIVGCCKRKGKFSHFPKESTWHYSGTFYWFRNRDLFGRKNWIAVPQGRYGAEAYPSVIFKEDEAGALFGDGFKNGYDLRYMNTLLQGYDYFKNLLPTQDQLDNANRNAMSGVRTLRTLDRKARSTPR